jgi:hypothetical protein
MERPEIRIVTIGPFTEVHAVPPHEWFQYHDTSGKQVTFYATKEPHPSYNIPRHVMVKAVEWAIKERNATVRSI